AAGGAVGGRQPAALRTRRARHRAIAVRAAVPGGHRPGRDGRAGRRERAAPHGAAVSAAAPSPPGPRVALLTPAYRPEVQRGTERVVRDLAGALCARGHRPRIVTSHRAPPRTTVEDGVPVLRQWRPPDARLRRRGYPPYSTHGPLAYLSLARGHDDLAHAFHPADAVAAVRWSGRTGHPTVFSAMGLPDRRCLASHRG